MIPWCDDVKRAEQQARQYRGVIMLDEPNSLAGQRRRQTRTLTRETLLAALPGPKGKPIGSIRVHVRVLHQGLNVRDHNIRAMLQVLAAAGFVEKTKKGRSCLWRKTPAPPPIDPNRRRSETMLTKWREEPGFRERQLKSDAPSRVSPADARSVAPSLARPRVKGNDASSEAFA
jgi:hypothetical protein